MTRLVSPLFILLVWLALWGEISVVNVGSGLIVVAIVVVLFRPVPRQHRLHPVGALRLLVVFVWRLITSSATVVLAVLAPTSDRLRSGVVGIPLSTSSPLVAAIISDAISLTPGTLTLDVRFPEQAERSDAPPVLYVHVLGLADPEAIREDVRRLERLVLSAVSPPPTSEVVS